MNICLSILGGASCKLFDELEDNKYLKQFKDPTLMEGIKGLHYIPYTVVSILDPLFFIIGYMANFAHFLTNKEGFIQPYERSIMYSYLLFFFIIDYKQINNLCFLDYWIFFWMLFWMAMEPLMGFGEISYFKLYARIAALFVIWFICFISQSKSVINVLCYLFGYIFVSVSVQYYSLKQKEKKSEEKNGKPKIKQIKQIKVKNIGKVLKKLKKKELNIFKLF
jgi:hypothetical protein